MENYVLCEEGIPLNWYSLLQRVTCKIALAFEVILEYGITEDTDLPTAKRGRIHPFKMGLNANWLYKETQCRNTVCSPKHCLWCRFLCLEKQAMGFLPEHSSKDLRRCNFCNASKTISHAYVPNSLAETFPLKVTLLLYQSLKVCNWPICSSEIRFALCMCMCLPFVESFLCYVCLPCEKKDLFPIRFIGIFFCVCISTSGSSCSLKRKCQMQTNIAEWTPKEHFWK